MNFYLFRFINQFAQKWPLLDSIGIFLAIYLGYILVFFLAAFLAIDFRKYWKLTLPALLSGGLARALAEIIRRVYPVNRPFVERQVNLLIYRLPSASFPSGHSCFFFALSFFLFFRLKKMKNPPKNWRLTVSFFFIASILIGIARVFTGIHWFSDILGGILIGLFAGWSIEKIAFTLFDKP